MTIPNSVTSIGGGAFSGCTGLTNVSIGNGVTTIGDGAFNDCTSLTAITVATGNPAYSSRDGALFDKAQTTLIRCPPGKRGAFVVPASVTGISAITCKWMQSGGCSSEAAFGRCASLTGIYFQGNAPSVAGDAFLEAGATVYYLPGTTGWDTDDFGDLQTALWLPEVRTSDGTFGIQTNRFGFTISWASDKVVVVEASESLPTPAWFPVSTNTLTGGTSYFSDPDSAKQPSRFYRVRAP